MFCHVIIPSVLTRWGGGGGTWGCTCLGPPVAGQNVAPDFREQEVGFLCSSIFQVSSVSFGGGIRIKLEQQLQLEQRLEQQHVTTRPAPTPTPRNTTTTTYNLVCPPLCWLRCLTILPPQLVLCRVPQALTPEKSAAGQRPGTVTVSRLPGTANIWRDGVQDRGWRLWKGVNEHDKAVVENHVAKKRSRCWCAGAAVFRARNKEAMPNLGASRKRVAHTSPPMHV